MVKILNQVQDDVSRGFEMRLDKMSQMLVDQMDRETHDGEI